MGDVCQPIQDFQITVFEFDGQRYLEFNFGLGDNGFGSVHAVGSADAIMSFDDDGWQPLVEPWKEWVQPPPNDDDEDRDDDDDDDDDHDYDGCRYCLLPPLLLALAKAIDANKVAEYGCSW